MTGPDDYAAGSLLNQEMVDRLRRLELFARTRVEGSRAGENRSPLSGYSTDFLRHRQYFPGDNLRYLDWHVLARSDRLVVKQFEELTNAEMAVVVDASGSMGHRGDGMSKWEFTVRCAAVLTYLMLLQRDSFSLHLFSEDASDYVPRGSGRRHLRRAFEKLISASPSGETRFAACFAQLEQRLSRKGLVLILSDFMAEPERLGRLLGRLRMRGHDVVAFQVFEPSEREMDFVDFTRFRDLEDGSTTAVDPLLIRAEYQKEFDAHQRTMKQECLARAIDHVVLAVEDRYDEALGDYLRHRMALMT